MLIFSAAPGTFSKVSHTTGHKSSLNKNKERGRKEGTKGGREQGRERGRKSYSLSPIRHGMKHLKINNKRNFKNALLLNNTPLNEHRVNQNISRTKKFLKTNDNKKTQYKASMMQSIHY